LTFFLDKEFFRNLFKIVESGTDDGLDNCLPQDVEDLEYIKTQMDTYAVQLDELRQLPKDKKVNIAIASLQKNLADVKKKYNKLKHAFQLEEQKVKSIQQLEDRSRKVELQKHLKAYRIRESLFKTFNTFIDGLTKLTNSKELTLPSMDSYIKNVCNLGDKDSKAAITFSNRIIDQCCHKVVMVVEEPITNVIYRCKNEDLDADEYEDCGLFFTRENYNGVPKDSMLVGAYRNGLQYADAGNFRIEDYKDGDYLAFCVLLEKDITVYVPCGPLKITTRPTEPYRTKNMRWTLQKHMKKCETCRLYEKKAECGYVYDMDNTQLDLVYHYSTCEQCSGLDLKTVELADNTKITKFMPYLRGNEVCIRGVAIASLVKTDNSQKVTLNGTDFYLLVPATRSIWKALGDWTSSTMEKPPTKEIESIKNSIEEYPPYNCFVSNLELVRKATKIDEDQCHLVYSPDPMDEPFLSVYKVKSCPVHCSSFVLNNKKSGDACPFCAFDETYLNTNITLEEVYASFTGRFGDKLVESKPQRVEKKKPTKIVESLTIKKQRTKSSTRTTKDSNDSPSDSEDEGDNSKDFLRASIDTYA